MSIVLKANSENSRLQSENGLGGPPSETTESSLGRHYWTSERL